MARQRQRGPFVPKESSGSSDARSGTSRSAQGGSKRKGSEGTGRTASQVIPDQVANRMARRVALATGLPTLLGMAVFVVSYVLVSRGWLAIPPSATLLASGACFLLGLVGLSYGVLSASWEDEPGSLLGSEQIGLNIGRIRASLQAMRRGSGSGNA